MLLRRLAKMHGIRRRAQNYARMMADYLPQAGDGAQSTASLTKEAQLPGSFEGRPKAEKWTKGEGKVEAIPRSNPRYAKKALPDSQTGLPAFGGVEPIEGLARSP